jgi:hypothetical protein
VTDLVHRPDIPGGDLIDNLVADAVSAAQEDVSKAAARIARLAGYPELRERYGDDLRAVIQWQGAGGRVVRADIHRQLRERGMSIRRIAAETGVGYGTVQRDLADPSGSPDEATSDPPGSPEPTLSVVPGDMEPTATHIAKHPGIATATARADLFKAMREIRPVKFKASDYAPTVAALPAEDAAKVRTYIAQLRSWIDEWEAALRPRPLTVRK